MDYFGDILNDVIMTLNKHEQVFLDLLNSGLWGKPFNFTGDKEVLSTVLGIAKSQSLTGIVAKVILDNRSLVSVISSELRLRLKSLVVSNAMTYEKMEDSIVRLSDHMSAGNLSFVLLKGHGVARFYPYPQLRQCGDIDIYVGDSQYEAVYNLLSEVYKCSAAITEIWDDKHFSVTDNEIEIEVHRKCDEHPERSKDKIFQEISQNFLNNGLVDYQIKGKPIKTPSDTFNVFYVFFHMFRHFVFGGVGLRQLCDWMMICVSRYDNIDLKCLEGMLTSMNMMSEWKDFAYMIVKYLGCPEAKVPFYTSQVNPRKIDRIFRVILSEGNFGHETSYYKNRTGSYLLNKFISLMRHISRFLQIAPYYPSHAYYYLIKRFKVSLAGLSKHK